MRDFYDVKLFGFFALYPYTTTYSDQSIEWESIIFSPFSLCNMALERLTSAAL